LILVPTPLEKGHLAPLIADAVARCDGVVEVCGFGLVAAAAQSAAAISQRQPERVLLLGIAGNYGDRVAVGRATRIDSVICDGVGAGLGDRHESASQLGWSMVESADSDSDTRQAIGDCIRLREGNRVLVSCCAASSNATEADARRTAYPDAVAEDMEGFAVALSCKLAGVPLTIIRGISNVAGDRNHAEWEIEAALRAAAELAIPILGGARDV